MAGTLHFVAMVTLGVATAVAVSRSFGRPTGKRLLAAALVGLASLLSGALFVHGCDAGFPLAQWAIGAGAAVVAVLFVRHARLRLALAIGGFATMLVLGLHYTALVHGDAWVGNPSSMALEAPARAEWHTSLTRLWARRAAARP